MWMLVAVIVLLSLACASTTPPPAPAIEPAPSGFLPLHWNVKDGKLLLEIPRLGQELIYQVSLASGVGSNPIGLDRGQLGSTHLIRFERSGPRVLMVQRNLRFTTIDGSAGERRAVEESFASSILWSFPVEKDSGGRLLVDATEFFLRDAHGVAARLREAKQGSYSVDAKRSAIYPPHTKAFPKNTEVEATITLVTSERPGNLISSVTPVAEVVTVRQHHSFVELPPPGYKPRRLDPRAGFFGIEVYDYASPFSGPLEKRFIARHRLQKKDPAAAVSDVVEPIIYYVDHGAPEPIRSALVEGASWWKEAFEKAGFRNAFEVRILPDDADPMDIRYNVINWVHRSTRGWSYGSAVVDPRTGEIIKGNVSLGSLRIRQDVMLGAGLIAPYEGPNPEVLATLDRSASPTELALARIRQLSAHEVGHTLGISHNMAASTYDRASVMDYPAPLIRIRDGRLDFSEAYDAGIGEFDAFAVRYGYSEFAPGTDEDAALARIVRDGVAAGMLYVSDEHSRDAGAPHPLGSVWDNGSDPIAMLRHENEVRRIALESFGVANLRPGAPLSELEPILLPLYLHHRYQLESAVKSLGGVMFTYAVREGSTTDIVPQPVREIVPPARQREALKAALETIEPSFLQIPQRIIDIIPPTADGYEGGIAERFDRSTGALFDPIAAARSAAAITLNALLHPARAARLVRFHAEDPRNPSLAEVTDSVVGLVSADVRESESHGALRRAVRWIAVGKLIEVAGDPATDAEVRAQYEEALRDLAARLKDPERRSVLPTIQRFLDRPAPPFQNPPAPAIPAGPPI
ncbi:MAG: zinc-dependent metalloprotease [Thermoanaerobaculia bacterium]